MPRAVLSRDVVAGVHRLEHADTNCYLIEDAEGVTLVDAAFPRTRSVLERALQAIDRTLGDLRAIVLTHAHFDHVGMAAGLQAELGIPVLVHELDRRLAAHPYSYAHERLRAPYPLRYPASIPPLGRMTLAGAFAARGVTDVRALVPGEDAAVPGHPRVLFTPGHTDGHCALHLIDRDAVLVGDALVTLDPYTGARGPRIVAGAATADSAENLRSLDAIAATKAAHVLPGHGDVWHGGAEQAVRLARNAPIA